MLTILKHVTIHANSGLNTDCYNFCFICHVLVIQSLKIVQLLLQCSSMGVGVTLINRGQGLSDSNQTVLTIDYFTSGGTKMV